MTIQDHKDYFKIMTDSDLLDQYSLYCELQSPGTLDQILLSLLEQEIAVRKLNTYSY